MIKLNLKIYFLLSIFSISLSYSQSLDNQKLRLALSFEKDGNFESAANLFLDLYKTNPLEKEYFNGYCRSLMIKEEYSKLLPFVRSHAEQYPSESAWILLGELYWRNGDAINADKTWEKVINAANDSQSYIDLSINQTKLRLFDKAIKTLIKGRKILNNNDYFAEELSQLYAITGDYQNGTEEIIKSYNRTNNEQVAEGRISALMNYPEAQNFIYQKLKIASSGNNQRHMRLFAWFLRTIKKYNEALELYKKIDNQFSSNGSDVFDFSLSSMNDGFYDIAIEGYNWIISKGTESNFSISALYNLARALELKQLSSQNMTPNIAEEIISNYRRVISEYPLTPTADDCKYNIANIYFQLGKYELSKKEIESLLKKFYNPATAAKANLLLAQLYFTIDDIDNSLKEYLNIVKLYKRFGNEYFGAKYSIAEIELFKGEIDSALAHFTDLTVQTANDVSNDALEKTILIEQNRNYNKGFGLFLKAEMKRKQNHSEQALKMYLEASEALPPGNLTDKCLFNASDIELLNKNYDRAKTYLDRIDSLNPTTIYADLADYKIAQILVIENKLTKAVELLTELIRKYPKSIYCEESRDLIVRIRSKIN